MIAFLNIEMEKVEMDSQVTYRILHQRKNMIFEHDHDVIFWHLVTCETEA